MRVGRAGACVKKSALVRAVTALATEIVDSTVESRLARLEVDAARLTPADDGGLFGDETLVLRQSHECGLVWYGRQ